MKQPYHFLQPEANRIYREKPVEAVTHKEVERWGFSDALTSLLMMTLTDGMVKNTLFSLLKDIMPYTEKGDQRQIAKMLGIRKMQNTYCEERLPHRVLTSTERLLGLLRTLKKYSAKGTSDQFTMLERFLCMRQKMDQNGGDMMPLVMDYMGSDLGKLMPLMNLLNHE